MKQPIEVVMLPTDNTNSPALFKYMSGKLSIDFKREPATMHHLYITVSEDIEPIKEGDYIYHKLDNTILQYSKKDNLKENPSEYGYRKIIATTDPNLGEGDEVGGWYPLPQVQQSFLKEYVANPNGKWEVEYEEYGLCIPCNEQGVRHCAHPEECGAAQILNRLKLNQNNTVTITSVEEKMFNLTLEDANDEFNRFEQQCLTNRKGVEPYEAFIRCFNWIKENLK